MKGILAAFVVISVLCAVCHAENEQGLFSPPRISSSKSVESDTKPPSVLQNSPSPVDDKVNAGIPEVVGGSPKPNSANWITFSPAAVLIPLLVVGRI